MYDYTRLVSEKVWQKLLVILPTPRQKRFGRRRCVKEALLNGVLQVLVNGVKWNNIGKCGASAASCWRYFHGLQSRGKLKLTHRILAKSKTDLKEGMIDTTTVDSFEFRYLTGWDGYNYPDKIFLVLK